MAGDATTLPLRGGTLGGDEPQAGRPRMRLRGPRAIVRAGTGVRASAFALGTIVLLSLFVVIVSADRPSGLAPTTHYGYFPTWMAGPLGGLWPGLTRDGNTLRYIFTAAILVMFASYLLLMRNVSELPGRWVVGAIAAVHAIFILAPPMALTDVFNYINYGRMEIVDHLNPYTTIPILEPHSDPSYALSNWHELLSPYGPLFTMLTFVVVPLGVAASFWVIKGLLALTSLATILLVWRCARLLGREPRQAVAFVGLNPIVLVWGLGGDHNDFLMVFCIMLGIYVLLLARTRLAARATPVQERADRAERARGRRWAERVGWMAGELRHGVLPLAPLEMGAGAALVTATALKASAAVLIPIVLVSSIHRRRAVLQMLIGMVIAGLLLGAGSLFAFGLHIPDLSTQSSLVTAESIPNLIGLAVGAGGETETLHVLMTLALGVSLLLCCLQAYRTRDPITACGWASVALLVTLSWVLPWYVLWALPFAALSRSRRLRRATAVLGIYLIVAWSPASGLLWNAIGFHPEETPVGRLHQRLVRELLFG